MDAPDLSRGMPLADRLLPAAPRRAPASDAARRRLTRWRRQEPFGDPALWHARLSADGLTEAMLLSLLDEPAEELAERVGPPFRRILPTADAETAPRPVTGQEPFLAHALASLIEPARDRLAAELRRLVPASAAWLPDQLVEALRWQVQAMVSRTVALELNLARANGELRGGDPAARFAGFLADLAGPARQRRLFDDYPVLGRQLSIAVDQWLANSVQLVHRANDDAAEIERHFASAGDLGNLAEITVDAGDRHRGGRSVAILRWDSGFTLVYKPRPLRLDVHFGQLIDWLNRAGMRLPLRAAVCLDRGDYGWVEFLTARPCADEAAIRRFYWRQGAYLALLELLRGNDIHSENLIAVGEHPVLVDLETILQPLLPADDERLAAAEHQAQAAARRSVLQVGLLPAPAWVTREGRAVDLSGLGTWPGQRTSVAVPFLTEVGTDTMRVQLERVPMALPDHRPVAKDADLNLLDYADDICAGYAQTHQLCRDRRAELLAPGGPVDALRGDPVRVVIRSTLVYDTLLRTGFHPDLLRDGLERDRHFDYLWLLSAHTPALASVIAAERRDLWRNDVPYLSARTDGPRLYDSDGEPIPGISVTAGLDVLRRDLMGWDDEHLRTQLSLIRGSLAAAAINMAGRLSFPDYKLPEMTGPAVPGALIETAERIGQRLRGDAFVAAGSAQWLGLNSRLGRNWSLGPLTPDLFNGLSGVALFLGELARLSGDSRHAALARQAVATIRHQLGRDMFAGAHGMAGRPGIAYAFCRLAVLLEDDSLITEAERVVETLRAAATPDVEYDIVSGSAGTIAALRILHTHRPAGPTLDVIAAAAKRLAEAAQTVPPGVGWMPAAIADQGLASVPLAGFGHGNAGIAWALGEAAQMLGDEQYAALARAAVVYERSLFDPELGGWKDVRQPDDVPAIVAWCHGAIGIGLARIASRTTVHADDPEVDGEISTALDSAVRQGFGSSHSLCHGDTGTVELLLTGASRLDRPDLRAAAARHAEAIRQSIDADGWICGVPFGTATPSLMVGLAGIGFGLLRAAAPGRVPSVLTLEPAAG